MEPNKSEVKLKQQDRLIRLWDLEARQFVRSFPGHTGPVCSLAFAPGDKRFVSCGQDGGISLWSLSDGK